ncbi:C6 zinc finger domain protein [Colletotrichum asianum]
MAHQTVAHNNLTESAVAVAGDLNLDTVIGLPPLFNDDFDALQFNNIFHGDTEEDLNEFFADIFSIPTYPRAGYESPPATVVSPLQRLVGAYTSEDDVLRSYYRFLHPAFPILPPPVDSMMDNVSDSAPPTNTYSPSSPVILAILSILIHVPQLRGHHSYPEVTDEDNLERSTSLSQHALHAITSWEVIKASETHAFSASRFIQTYPENLRDHWHVAC